LERRFAAIGPVQRTEKNGAVHLFAQNSPLFRYGVVIVHCSLLFVLAGALVRALVGVEGQIALPEGGSVNVFAAKNDELMRLPFDVRCEKFAMEMYPGTQRPKEYRSTLSVWQDGKKIDEQTIRVNHPLSVGAFHFYQASYGEDEFPVLRLTGPGLTTELPVVAQQVQSIPGRRDGFIVDQARREAETLEVHVLLTAGGDQYDAWLREKGPAQNLGPYAVSFVGVRQGYYTGVMVTADPGVRLLYIGFGVFFVGLFLAFYTSHKRVWARIAGGEATLAVSASRNREAAKAWLDETAAAAKG
jgi:cytochrome c biogenesis protein